MAKNKKRQKKPPKSKALSPAEEASIKADRPFAIALIIIGSIILIVGIITGIRFSIRVNKCTNMTTGMVVDVDSREKKEDDSSYTQYKAYISFDEDSPLAENPIESPWSRKKYEEGQKITVFYDPDDVTNYYIEDMSLNPGPWIVIFGLLLLITGITGCKFGLGTPD